VSGLSAIAVRDAVTVDSLTCPQLLQNFDASFIEAPHLIQIMVFLPSP
jgi:hypothetical protein